MKERDFMGLSSSKESAVLKEDNNDDGCRDSGLTSGGGGGAHWPFLNKVSAVPHFMSFKGDQEDKTKKMVPDSFLSSRFVPLSTSDAFDPCQRRPTCDAQYINHDRQGGSHFPLTAYPTPHNLQSMHRPYDMKMVSVSNQGISVPMGNPYLKNHFASMGQNFAVTTTKQQSFGGSPVTTTYLVPPSSGSLVGTTEPRNNVNTSGLPSQMTIFYAGSVNVYNDISPEKAQAMMVLAQNGSSNPSNGAHSKAETPKKLPAETGVPVNQAINPPPSAFPSPLSVSSHTGTQSVSGSTSADELITAKPTGLPTTPVSKVEPQKTAVKSVAATAMNHTAIPQARKASLARFLGKRKERVINSAPYNLSKKSAEGSNPESNGKNSPQAKENNNDVRC
ncbi:protein TIFY 6B-like isoform X2 [Argentina anserina]|uniref:protein TIFY 6B-like isoform X2 n=1 Tax=Argentina anserina TaxID=57926 RepID=UPI0021768293|nr:protein TIFY 6B-like isoform X2 [Potentilla anserina]